MWIPGHCQPAQIINVPRSGRVSGGGRGGVAIGQSNLDLQVSAGLGGGRGCRGRGGMWGGVG